MKIEIQEFHKNGYFLYRQLVNTDLSLFFMNYLGLKKLCFETNDSTPGAGGHWGDTIVGDVYNLYGDAMFDTLLVTLQPTVEEIAKLAASISLGHRLSATSISRNSAMRRISPPRSAFISA